MNLWLLRPGHKIRTRDGAEAEVLAETEDGAWIKVRYLEVEDDPSLGGTEDLVSGAEVEALLGLTQTETWGDKVTVLMHYIPESEEYEGGYEAETITGVPYDVKVSGGAPLAQRRPHSVTYSMGFERSGLLGASLLRTRRISAGCSGTSFR